MPEADSVTRVAAAAEGVAASWPLRIGLAWPGPIRVLQAPRDALYDVNGGPDLPDADGLTERLLDCATWPRPWPRVVLARAVAAEGPFWRALGAMAGDGRIGLAVVNRWDRALLDRAAAPDAEAYLRSTLSGERRKRLRQKRKALEAEAGSLSFVAEETPHGVAETFAVFCALEKAGWKGRAGTALAQDPPGLAHVEGLLLSKAEAGSALTALLKAGETPVAAGLFLRSGGEAVFWKTTYDERVAKHSPGVLFDIALTEWLYAQPWFERLDAGHDDSVDPSSLIWRQRRPMADIVIDLSPGSLRGRLVVAGQRLRLLLRNLKRRYAK